MSIVMECERLEHLAYASTTKTRILRNHALFLERHNAVSRSDCETKYDVRMEAHFCIYDEQGLQQTDPLLSRQFDACHVGQGGTTYRNYLNLKDPQRKGDWSDTVETRPLRVGMLVDPMVPWLKDHKTVGFLCSVRVKRDFYRCMEALGEMPDIPAGKTWTDVKRKDVQGNKLLPLQAATIASLIVTRAEAGGLLTGKTETAAAADMTNKGRDRLAGHFLRGHAGSTAFTLAVHHGGQWDPLLGVSRARHTLQSFEGSYSRGVAPRLIAAFEKHRYKHKLRFEEASRL